METFLWLLLLILAPRTLRLAAAGDGRQRCQLANVHGVEAIPPPGMASGLTSAAYFVYVTNISTIPPLVPEGAVDLNRGTIFIPEKSVDPKSYIPYAIADANRARYSVILLKPKAHLVTKVIRDNPHILTWALVAHGKHAASVAAKVEAEQGVTRITAIALIAAVFPHNAHFVNSNLGVYVYFGASDTCVSPTTIKAFASQLPSDALITLSAKNANQSDLGFTTCAKSCENLSAQVAAILQPSLFDLLRFQPWTVPTPRALFYGDNGNLIPGRFGSVPYPSPVNPVNFSKHLVSGLTLSDPLRYLYVFTPSADIKGGLIYFQGAAVNAKSYFPLAFEIAARGHLVVLLEQPGRVTSTSDPEAISRDVNSVIGSRLFSGVTKWAVGAHSAGGRPATLYASMPSSANHVYAVVLHAGLVGGDLQASFLPVIQIFGSLDRFIRPSNLLLNLNPRKTTFVNVTGANHEQTGDYRYIVKPNGFVAATITVQQQQITFAEKTVEFLEKQ